MILRQAFGIVGALWAIIALPLLLLWFSANDNPWGQLPFSDLGNPIQRIFATLLYVPPLAMIGMFFVRQPSNTATGEDGS
jgi:hypothetical protein